MSSTCSGASDDETHILTPPFDSDDADVIIRSSDQVDFPVHRFLLFRASNIIDAALPLPQPKSEPSDVAQGLPVVTLAEDRRTLEIMLRLCYPIDVVLPSDFIECAQSVVEAIRKYALTSAMLRLESRMSEMVISSSEPLRFYALACSYGLEDLARKASRRFLKHNALGNPYSSTLKCMTGGAYHRLLQYHWTCSRAACAVVNEDNVIAWARSPNWSSSILFHVHNGCTAARWEQVGGLAIRDVVRYYLRSVRDVVASAPEAVNTFNPASLQEVLRLVSSCAYCASAIHDEMTKFILMLKSEMNKSIQQVSLVFEQQS
ncbi:hypothetical protein CERSUDRAFT_155629 [Gelatoporia subvermispora B]|uniref:BTB domain-containing protein n=1 Tax=Ceriporiopsis subvermispora (strain B) TaxID=914234 RepID=M2QY97_CERS8|nr:hypothetical protein CERSUDRAFT_155629 [Gelatoporia subvermispora B]